jgi:(E)-4-hydroxy-3-methylbut-2-enyl-diphosphate synthase
MHGESPIKRRESRKIWVGNVPVGGDAPIAVQSMTNTDTNDVMATVAQIQRLVDAGVDIVRVSVPDMDAAEAFGKIKQLVSVPLVADIHFDYKIALRVAELGVDCLRINPGNIGREDRVRAVVDAARDRGIPIRIGVNAGSLEKDLQKKYGEPTRPRWSNRPCVTSSTSTAWTSRTSRSASRPPTCSWPSKPTACWPSRSSSRCT